MASEITNFGVRPVKMTNLEYETIALISTMERMNKQDIYLAAWIAIQDKRDGFKPTRPLDSYPWREQRNSSEHTKRIGVKLPPVEVEALFELCDRELVSKGAVLYTMLFEYINDYLEANPQVMPAFEKIASDLQDENDE